MQEGSGRPSDLRGAQGVQIGDHNIQTNIFGGVVTVSAPVEVSWPVRAGAIPLLAGCYQERDESRLLSDAVATHVLSGLGGVGKTQLAAAYARTRSDLDLLAWVNAGSRDAIVAGYAEAAARLGHPVADDAERAARWLLTWMQTTAERSWLVVLDDLADPADLRGLWPDGPKGQAVITTRRTDAALARAGQRVEVGLFTPGQARAYLAAKLDADPDGERMREADELAVDLGHLPLALAQAGAFILDRGDTCARYRTRLADRRRRLAELFPPDALADDYQETVAAAWSISIEAADALQPVGLARPVLELHSVLDPNGIPSDLLGTDAALAYTASRVASRVASSPHDGQDLSDALHHLARLSLISLDPAGGAAHVRVHGLVQRATVEGLDPGRVGELHRAAADGVLEIWPQVEREPRLGQVLRANATTLATRAGADLWHPRGHRLLWRTGYSLGDCGLVHEAIRHWTRVESDAHRHLGPDHIDSLDARGNLATARSRAGDPVGAAAAYERLLTDTLRVLGPEHPDTLISRHNLAHLRGEAGDPAGAATAFQALLTDELRVLGPDHPTVLATRHQLARWQGEAGDPAGAATALEELLTDELRVLGPDAHPTLITRHSLADWRGRSGDPRGALVALEQLLADLLRLLGPDHPYTLGTRRKLANWQGHAGDPADAITALQELLIDELRVLGPDHPDTLETRHNTAFWRGRVGDVAGAAATAELLLTDELRLLGPEHPTTFVTRHQLAHWQGQAGDPGGAAAALQALLTDELRVLGADHPTTVGTHTQLAHWQDEAGDRAGAFATYERLLPVQQRLLGPDHLEVLSTRYILARWQGEAGDVAGAATATRQLLADFERVLGPDHHFTRGTRRDLARWSSGP